MKKYFFISSAGDYHAGLKATNDCTKILKKMGYHAVYTNGRFRFPPLTRLNKIVRVLGLVFVPKGSILLLQHPIAAPQRLPFVMGFVKLLKRLRKIKVIVFIYDLESLRSVQPEFDRYFIKADRLMSEAGDIMITHNKVMNQELIHRYKVPEQKLVAMQVFDYLIDKEYQIPKRQYDAEPKIVIAANLMPQKAGYVYRLPMAGGISYRLYGIGYQPGKQSHVEYAGAYHPDELVKRIEGQYGLVWDGPAADTCAGTVGTYLRYNTPHKVSLYLLAGLPIIIWEDAALADFVRQEQIGFTIGSLNELAEKLQNISEEDYQAMAERVRSYAGKIRQGTLFKKAVYRAEGQLKKG